LAAKLAFGESIVVQSSDIWLRINLEDRQIVEVNLTQTHYDG